LKQSFEEKKVKVKYVLTGTTARLEIRLDGQPEQTNEQINRIQQAISSYYNSGSSQS
jgi:hypothetical protein